MEEEVVTQCARRLVEHQPVQLEPREEDEKHRWQEGALQGPKSAPCFPTRTRQHLRSQGGADRRGMLRQRGTESLVVIPECVPLPTGAHRFCRESSRAPSRVHGTHRLRVLHGLQRNSVEKDKEDDRAAMTGYA